MAMLLAAAFSGFLLRNGILSVPSVIRVGACMKVLHPVLVLCLFFPTSPLNKPSTDHTRISAQNNCTVIRLPPSTVAVILGETKGKPDVSDVTPTREHTPSSAEHTPVPGERIPLLVTPNKSPAGLHLPDCLHNKGLPAIFLAHMWGIWKGISVLSSAKLLLSVLVTQSAFNAAMQQTSLPFAKTYLKLYYIIDCVRVGVRV
eukprot:GHVR01077326.1.p1 GENE.GHVR01077326.1~~GHVR01077326.1.p1  ORF type:complete len:202 (+),score=16.88 GHVR01077326.1:1779-2384(+)